MPGKQSCEAPHKTRRGVPASPSRLTTAAATTSEFQRGVKSRISSMPPRCSRAIEGFPRDVINNAFCIKCFFLEREYIRVVEAPVMEEVMRPAGVHVIEAKQLLRFYRALLMSPSRIKDGDSSDGAWVSCYSLGADGLRRK